LVETLLKSMGYENYFISPWLNLMALAVTQAGCTHECTVVAGRKPKDVSELQWINTVLGNLKTSLSGATTASALESRQRNTSAPSPADSIAGSISRHCPNDCWWPQRSAGRTRSARFGWWLKFIANQE
jgi:hypothetical protein